MQGVLANRYRLERQLGKGGMGSVWLAEHLALRSWVAVKLMDPAIAATPEGAERFRREAQAAASLRSAHVVQVLDYGVHEQTPFLVMELLQGESLAACLGREQRLTPARTLSIMTQVARALGRAHAAGIVHRDLKPDNVFLVKEDDQELVKILDFGIAKTPPARFGGMETRTGVTMGTPYYMSPEQAEGKRAVDFRTDLWAMAVITSECMTGVRPFDGSTYGELLLNICARPIAPPSSHGLALPGFDAWFAKATSRDAEQRFTSAQELVSSFAELVAPVAAATTSQAGPGAAPSGTERRRAWPWVVLAAAALVAALGAVLLLGWRPNGSAAAAPASSSLAATTTTATGSSAEQLPSTPSATLASPAESAARAAETSARTPRTPSSSPLGAASSSPLGAASSSPLGAASSNPAPRAENEGAAPAPLGRVARCFSDPFSGQVRPAGAARPATAPTFACQMDPFTGKYRKL
jgi:eukaryotic-like serine/threonine-protein kinase